MRPQEPKDCCSSNHVWTPGGAVFTFVEKHLPTGRDLTSQNRCGLIFRIKRAPVSYSASVPEHCVTGSEMYSVVFSVLESSSF